MQSETKETVTIQLVPFGSLQISSEIRMGGWLSKPAAREGAAEEPVKLLEDSTTLTKIVSQPRPTLCSGPPLFYFAPGSALDPALEAE